MVRLKAVWEQEYQQWTRRDLSAKRYVYFWADGLHVNVRLDEERSCILVIMGADEHGTKELVAVSDGYRESTASWRELLLDLRRRGLSVGPRLATADGALGFWAALREVYSGDRGTDLLVPQGRQRAGQDAQVSAGQSEDDDSRDMAGAVADGGH